MDLENTFPMQELGETAIPIQNSEGLFGIVIPFFLNEYASDVGIQALIITLLLAPGMTTCRLSARRDGGREIELFGPDASIVSTTAVRVIEMIREMGDVLPHDIQQEPLLRLEPLGIESTWVFEPPEDSLVF